MISFIRDCDVPVLDYLVVTLALFHMHIPDKINITLLNSLKVLAIEPKESYFLYFTIHTLPNGHS